MIIRRLESTDAGTYRCQLDLKGESANPYKDGELIVLGMYPIGYGYPVPTNIATFSVNQ